MSLMQLLTTGKTLVDLKNTPHRYQMPGKNFLPKFGTVKDPFKTAAKNPTASAPVVVVTEARTKPSYTRPVKVPAADLKKTQRLPESPAKMKETKRLPFVAARNGVQKQNLTASAWKKILGTLGAAAAKWNPLAWWSARKAPAKSAVPRFSKPAVQQGELSLENIKVVRNDLQETDLDVLPARTLTGETNFKPALQSQSKPELAVSPGAAA